MTSSILHSIPRFTIWPLFVLALLARTSPSLSAQAVMPPPAATDAGIDDEIVKMSVFEVTESLADTYEAQNTNSITGTKMELGRVPIFADVFNQKFMEDFGFTDISDILVEVGGAGPPLMGGGSETATGYQQGDINDFKSFSIRGLTSSNQRRDGFIRSDGTTLDNFDIESVETIHGPQSLLYGAGDAGGVINFVSKRAHFRKKSLRAEGRFNSENSYRYTADANYGSRNFAVRAVYMNEDWNYWRKNTGRESEGYYATIAVRPMKSVIIHAQYRDYTRREINARGASIYGKSGSAASLRDLLYRYNEGSVTQAEIERFGTPEEFLSFWNWENVDSAFGGSSVRNFEHTYADITANIVVSKNVDLQFRWGKDERLNNAIVPFGADESSGDDNSVIAVLHPDRSTNTLGEWAIKTRPKPEPYWTGQSGPRVQANFKFNIGRSSYHQLGVAYQLLDSYTKRIARRFYEIDLATGAFIQDARLIGELDAGRSTLTQTLLPVFSRAFYGDAIWPTNTVFDPVTGKTYKLADVMMPGWGTATEDNPLGLNGVNEQHKVGSKWYSHMKIREEALLASLYSEWFNGKMDTMLGVREERFKLDWISHGIRRTDSLPVLTTGAVWHIAGKLRGYANYSTNANTPASPDQIDIYNDLLPFGEGHSWEAGFKFDFFNRRLSGSVAYYDATAKNIPRTLSGELRDDVDPRSAINGDGAGDDSRNGGPNYSASITSRGVGLTISARPFAGWETRMHYTLADGMERKTVRLPVLYNDQFNTMPDARTVAVRDHSTGTLSPLMVYSVKDDDTSPMIPLTIDMMQADGPYHADLDPISGCITNAADLGLSASGVGTGNTGLPISQHQLGFVQPNDGTVLIKQAGDKSTGYSTHFISFVNTYRFRSGFLRGFSLGATATWQIERRGFYWYPDADDIAKRELFYYPSRFEMRGFASYRFKLLRKYNARLQINVSNILNEQITIRIPYSSQGNAGRMRYARLEYSPRAYTLTAAVEF